jgi:hypothetical protein
MGKCSAQNLLGEKMYLVIFLMFGECHDILLSFISDIDNLLFLIFFYLTYSNKTFNDFVNLFKEIAFGFTDCFILFLLYFIYFKYYFYFLLSTD